MSQLVQIHHLWRQRPYPDSKVHGDNMGPTWALSAPGGPHVAPMNLAIRVYSLNDKWSCTPQDICITMSRENTYIIGAANVCTILKRENHLFLMFSFMCYTYDIISHNLTELMHKEPRFSSQPGSFECLIGDPHSLTWSGSKYIRMVLVQSQLKTVVRRVQETLFGLVYILSEWCCIVL